VNGWLLQLRAWLFGYVSGANSAMQPEGELFDEGDSDGLAAWIDKYCSEEPLSRIGDGANLLVRDLLTRGIASGKIKL
jgi:hypothetical protein